MPVMTLKDHHIFFTLLSLTDCELDLAIYFQRIEFGRSDGLWLLGPAEKVMKLLFLLEFTLGDQLHVLRTLETLRKSPWDEELRLPAYSW